MGLDFSHCDLRMSYGSFSVLRGKLAHEAGIDLRTMAGYGGDRSWDSVDDALVPLLASYDEYGGGEISKEHCLSVKRRVEELAMHWSSKSEQNAREWAFALAHAMAKAAFLGESFHWF